MPCSFLFQWKQSAYVINIWLKMYYVEQVKNLNLETKLKYTQLPSNATIQTWHSLTWLAKASLISYISMSFRVRPMGQKSQELKGDIFASWLYQGVVAWQPPSVNSSSTASKKEEPQLPCGVSTLEQVYVQQCLKTAKHHSSWHCVTESAKFPQIKCDFYAEGLRIERCLESER